MQDLMDTAEKCCITAPALIFTARLARIHPWAIKRPGWLLNVGSSEPQHEIQIPTVPQKDCWIDLDRGSSRL